MQICSQIWKILTFDVVDSIRRIKITKCQVIWPKFGIYIRVFLGHWFRHATIPFYILQFEKSVDDCEFAKNKDFGKNTLKLICNFFLFLCIQN